MRDYTAKHDQGKIDWALLPWKIIERSAKIMTDVIRPKEEGGEGYGRASWRTVPGGFFRYWAAMQRHIFERFVLGEVLDKKSGEPHTAHIICNAAFVGEMDLEYAEECKKTEGTRNELSIEQFNNFFNEPEDVEEKQQETFWRYGTPPIGGHIIFQQIYQDNTYTDIGDVKVRSVEYNNGEDHCNIQNVDRWAYLHEVIAMLTPKHSQE